MKRSPNAARDGIISWKNKFLLKLGKEVVLKVIVQALLVYRISVLVLPSNTCDSLQKMMKYLETNDRRRIHWPSWEYFCVPKKFGRIGFHNLHCFNVVMLAKLFS
ncbi:hypothetical protein ERO13_D12G126050v2 [Gossypium hirsutum]|uniref:Uncharacterized protein n=1 Tax=Gossypium darwinii TaxID=34276 RepID=A0A5D2A9N6_GOSDA|nr:hypothetical protein ERO13_D12G126050v2 [Gossypium hirsutum]TYG41119.1 hypothetical protein ES288_D12G149500v1 [Gossypium darwinii]